MWETHSEFDLLDPPLLLDYVVSKRWYKNRTRHLLGFLDFFSYFALYVFNH